MCIHIRCVITMQCKCRLCVFAELRDMCFGDPFRRLRDDGFWSGEFSLLLPLWETQPVHWEICSLLSG